VCTGATCGEDECCDDRQACTEFGGACGAGDVKIAPAVTTYCTGIACDATSDVAQCCGPPAVCTDYGGCSGNSKSGAPKVVKNSHATQACVTSGVCEQSAENTANCCVDAAPCTSMNCNGPRIAAHATTWCSTDVCGEDDHSTCCRKECTAFECPDKDNGAGGVDKQDTVPCERFCFGASCAEGSDASFNDGQCCEIKDTCGSGNLACPAGKIMKANVEDVDCFSIKCTLEDDVDTCCEDRAPCSQYVCAEGFQTIGDGTQLCAGAGCVADPDDTTCCEALGQCEDYTCNPALNHVMKTGAPKYCEGTTCSDDECCVERALCSVTCGAGKGLKINAKTTIYCAGETCDDDDNDACCEDKETCTGMMEGDGRIYCSTVTTCETSLMADAFSRECPGGSCTTSFCCVPAEGGAPPIVETLDEPAETATLVSSFTIREMNFETLNADASLVRNLKDNICKTYTDATDVELQCQVKLTAGSVNVEVTITPAAGETDLPVMKAPLKDDLIAAVVSTAGIEATQEGGKSFDLSEVKAVVFEKGSTEASEITTTTPKPKGGNDGDGSDGDGDETDDTDVEDSAAGLSVAIPIVAAGMLNLFASIS